MPLAANLLPFYEDSRIQTQKSPPRRRFAVTRASRRANLHRVSNQVALKLLFELRAVLDRISEDDNTLHEALAHDVDRAMRLADSCIAQLTQEPSNRPETDDEEEE